VLQGRAVCGGNRHYAPGADIPVAGGNMGLRTFERARCYSNSRPPLWANLILSI
jgi:hypothetical protein